MDVGEKASDDSDNIYGILLHINWVSFCWLVNFKNLARE